MGLHPPLGPEVQNALVKRLKKIPHRTYLLLRLDVIRKSLDSTVIRLERLIDRLPHTVEDAYEKILARINDSELAKQARRLLHIVLVRNISGLLVIVTDSRIYLIYQTPRKFLISKNIDCISKNLVNSNSKFWKHSFNSVGSNLGLVKICLFFCWMNSIDNFLKWRPLWTSPHYISMSF